MSAAAKKTAAALDVLFITWNFPPRLGGIEQVISSLYEGLADRGDCRLTVFTSKAPAGHADTSTPAPVRRAAFGGLLGFNLHAMLGGLCHSLKHPHDVILCGSLAGIFPAFTLGCLFRRPVVLITYGSELVISSRLFQALMKVLLRRIARIVAISRYTRALLLERGVAPERIVIIHPGLEVPESLDTASETTPGHLDDLVRGRRVLLAAGRLVRRKGFLELVSEIMPRVLKHTSDVVLLVAGSDPSESLIHKESLSAAMKDAIKANTLEDHVHLLGRVSDDELQALFGQADVFVMPCLNIPNDVEGFGIVFQEAALYNVPSVSSRVGGVPDAVQDRETGILTEPGDFPAQAEAISGLLQNEEKRLALGAAARERALREFAWPHIVAQYRDALQAAVAQRNSAPSPGSAA